MAQLLRERSGHGERRIVDSGPRPEAQPQPVGIRPWLNRRLLEPLQRVEVPHN